MINNKRIVFEFQDEKNFWSRVHDRMHSVVERYVFQSLPKGRRYPATGEKGNLKFTLIINGIPRDKPREIYMDKPYPLSYVSIPTQRRLLEDPYPVLDKEVDNAWTALIGMELESNIAAEGSISWKKVKENKYTLEDILSDTNNTLEAYFNPLDGKLNASQLLEKPILNYHFNIKSSPGRRSARYLEIPLIQFGEIDGFVYLVYEDEDHDLFDPHNIMDLIVGFSIEYEGVILAWDLAEEDYERSYAFRERMKQLCSKDNIKFFENKSPIFKELGFPEYYSNHRKYYKDRFEQHDEMLSKHYDQLIKHGSTTILLDSFAHNISAHALTTLTWIFKKRSKLKLRTEQLTRITQLMNKEVENVAKERYALVKDRYDHIIEKYEPSKDDFDTTYAELINFKGSLTREIFPFLKFLQEKGGFWSGLTRDINAGGQVNTFFSILWYDFIYNALYLGTIAESENIRKLHIDITLYDNTLVNVKNDKAFTIKLPKARVMRFATIDLDGESIEHLFDINGKDEKNRDGDWYIEQPNGSRIWYEDLPGLENLSRFVHLGGNFLALRDELKKVKIFFPGSVVGKHALFTMIENELRNIKHYFGKGAEVSQKRNEMTLNISIRPASLGKNNSVELYQIGLWLGLSSKLADYGRFDKNYYLVKRRFDMLWKDIIDEESRQPILGGNSQDKVCASMLFNSSFSSVQQGSFRTQALGRSKGRNVKRDAMFYPWITPTVCYDNCDTEFRVPAVAADFEVEYDKETGGVSYPDKEIAFKEQINAAFKDYEMAFESGANGMGILKKYIYAWRGETIRTDEDDDEMAFDHMGRFKFVMVEPDNDSLWKNARKNGVIRLIKPIDVAEEGSEEEKILKAYLSWLSNWFDEPFVLSLADGNTYNISSEKEEGNVGVFIGAFVFDKSRVPCLSFHLEELAQGEHGKDIRFRLSEETSALVQKQGGLNIQESFIACAHNKTGVESDVVRYRRHGVLYQHYIQDAKVESNLSLSPIPSALLPEFFEFMATRVCLFDNRLFNRADKKRLTFYQDKLKLFFCPEAKLQAEDGSFLNAWGDDISKEQIKKSHFLIIHLSYIDRILNDKYSSIQDFDGNIGLFIEKELKPLVGKADGSGLRDNFILIVTTGRGRQTWQEFLEMEDYEKYKKSVIFRPIESLISAMEDSLMLNDDFDLKYRIVKVLFGS